LKEAEHQNILWTKMPIEVLRKISPAFASDISGSLSLAGALSSKRVPGGTAPEAVRVAIAELEKFVLACSEETKSKAQAK
jgi:argininosuccinate lyase